MNGLAPRCRVFVQPDIRRRRITISSTVPGASPVRAQILGTEFAAEGRDELLLVPFSDFVPWSPASPQLYTVKCVCSTGDTAPLEIAVRFGMREFTVHDKRFHLNGRSFFVRAAHFDFGANRGSGPDDTAFRASLTEIKRAGFNTIRIVAACGPESLLRLTDEIGLLVWLVGGGERAQTEFSEQDWNHPSLVLREWVGGDPESAAVQTLRQGDPSRVLAVRNPSARTRAWLARPYGKTWEEADWIQLPFRAPSEQMIERYGESLGNPNRLVFVHEPDAGESHVSEPGHPPGGIPLPEAVARGAEAARQDALRAELSALRANPRLAGYCVSRWRGLDHRALNPLQAPLLPVIRAAKTNLVPREEVAVHAALVNEERSEFRGELSLQVVGPTNQVLWKKKRAARVAKGAGELWSGQVSASGSPGLHRFVVRLIQGGRACAQNHVDLHVFDPAAPCDAKVDVIDPHGEWRERCLWFAKSPAEKAQIYVVPRLGNTVRAYPEASLVQVLGEARAGAVGLIFSPPDDWNDFAARVDSAVACESFDVSSVDPACVHVAHVHPMFDGLTSGGVLGEAYGNVLPLRAFRDPSDEEAAAAMLVSGDPPAIVQTGNDLVVKSYGAGRLVFTHFRLLENLGRDALADRLFVNLLRHLGRRSVPADETVPVAIRAMDWLRRERMENTRLWMVCGPFANWSGSGHDIAYPPETNVDLGAAMTGWMGAVSWTRLYATSGAGYVLRPILHSVEPLGSQAGPIPGTMYAYAEASCPARVPATARFLVTASAKVWVNRTLVHESRRDARDAREEEHEIPLTLRQGRNTVLVKLSSDDEPAAFSLRFESDDQGPLVLSWWR